MEEASLESQLATSLLCLSKPLMENSYVILHGLGPQLFTLFCNS